MQPFDNSKDIETSLLKKERQSRMSSFTYVRPSDLDPHRASQSDTIFGRLERAYPDKIGFYYLLCSILLMSFNAYFTQQVGELIVPEINFLRSLFMMVGIYFFITRYKSELNIGDKRHKKVVLALCLIGFPTALSYVFGLVNWQLSEAVTIMISTPIFVSIFSWFIFAQHFKKEQIYSLVLWLIGVTLVIRSPASGADSADSADSTDASNTFDETARFIGIVASLINVLLTATSSIVVKATNVRIPPIMLMTYGTICNLILSGTITCIFGFTVPEFHIWVKMMIIGFLFFYGQFFLMKSLEHISSGVNAALINNIQIALIYVIQIIFVQQIPSFWNFTGTIFVVAACVVLASMNK